MQRLLITSLFTILLAFSSSSFAEVNVGKRKKALVSQVGKIAYSSHAAQSGRPISGSNQKTSEQHPEISVVTGHSVSVTAIAFSPDEKILATGDDEGAIKLWNSQNGAGLRTLVEKESLALNNPGVSSLAFSIDGKVLASARVVWPDKEED